MRKALVLVALFGVVGTAFALTQRFLHSKAAGTGNPTGTYSLAAPTTASQGMSLDGVKAFRISTCAVSHLADAGTVFDGVLDGTGTVDVYLYDPNKGTWAENVQLKQNVDATGVCEVFPDFSTDMYAASGYRLYLRPVSVGYTRGDGGVILVDAVKFNEVK